MSLKNAKFHQLAIGGGLLAAILILLAGVCLTRGISIRVDMDRCVEAPSSQYPLGADELGRDLVSSVTVGAGISLLTGLAVVLISAVVGGLLGMIAGLAGGIIDAVIMRIVDVILSFPGFLLAVSLAAFFTPGILTLILVLTVSGWVGCARLVRGEVLKYKQKEFILAARSMNASFFRIVFSHLLPLVLPLIVVQASLDIAGVVLAESGLNFLGVGLDPEIPSLGQLIDAGRGHLFDNPRLIAVPGLVLFSIIIAFNFIGEGLRKRLTR